jgi:hypothetical protein
MTQRTASMVFDLPQPFGPTIADRLVGKGILVGSTNDLKPANLMLFKRIGDCSLIYAIRIDSIVIQAWAKHLITSYFPLKFNDLITIYNKTSPL